MSDARLSRLEVRLEGLERKVQALESALLPRVEDAARAGGASAHAISATEIEDAESVPDARSSGPSVVSLLGRFLIILGGAFLLRAATDSGAVPASAGVTVGLLYGVAQLGLASRAALRGHAASANWFGFGAAFILLPLIAESTLDFDILPPWLASILLTALGLTGVAVAFRHRMRPMAWAFLAGTGSVGLFLSAKTGFAVGFPVGVIVVGIAGLWMGYLRQWYGLAIVGSVVPVALVTGLTLLMALDFRSGAATSLTPAVALVLQLTLVAGFLGSFLARALRWSAPVGMPEMAQAIIAMFIGITGALVSVTKDTSLGAPFGVAMLVTGQVCYAVSFLRIDRRQGDRRNFAFFSTVALAATLTGSAQILRGRIELFFFLAAALALAFFGARRRRATLSLHAAIYVVAAGFGSALLPKAVDALTGAAALPPPGVALGPMILVILAGLVCLATPVMREGKTWGRLSRMPEIVCLGFLSIAIGGLLVAYLTKRFAVLPEGEFDAGMVAAFRTGALSMLAILLALIARWSRLREAARLVPGILVLAALALGLGDLRSGRPATQFASLALYGIALIAGPHFARRATKRDRSLPGSDPGPADVP